MANFNINDLHYAAGIIDGEGYIGITISEPRGKAKSTYFNTVVNVGMADLEIPAWLQEIFGGSLYSYPSKNGKTRGVFHWKLSGVAAIEFCKIIRPFLKLKNRQAEILIRFREDERLDFSRHGGAGVRVPIQEIDIKRDYASQVRKLNQREMVVI